MKNSILFGFFGLVSGLLSYFVIVSFEDSTIILLYIIAGALFGVFIYGAVLVSHYKPLYVWGPLMWICISTASYAIAVWVVLDSLASMNHNLAFLIGGFTGSILMLIGLRFLLVWISLPQFFSLAILGIVLSQAWFLPLAYSLLGGEEMIFLQLLTLYVCWQTGMAMGLGYALYQNETGAAKTI